MTADVFVDTNVLVYDQDSSEIEKQRRAHRWLVHLWKTRRGRLSVQVLNEYYLTVTRKLTPGLPVELARADVQHLFTWNPIGIDNRVIERAWALEGRFSLSWWDTLIVAAAQLAGCRFLLTEDLQDGQEFDGLRVINPMTHEFDELDL